MRAVDVVVAVQQARSHAQLDALAYSMQVHGSQRDVRALDVALPLFVVARAGHALLDAGLERGALHCHFELGDSPLGGLAATVVLPAA